MKGFLEAMLEDFTDEELKDMGYSDSDIDSAWSELIRSDMADYYA